MANKIIIIENGTKRETDVEKIPGLKVVFAEGDDNLIEIEAPFNINNLSIKIKGNHNRIVIEKNCRFSNTVINMNVKADNRSALIGNKNIIIDSIFDISGESDSVIIGNDCVIKSKARFHTQDGHTIFDINTKKVVNYGGNIIIEDHVFIGNNSFIGKKVKICKNSVILPCSNVVKSIESPDTLIGGNPATILREGINFSV